MITEKDYLMGRESPELTDDIRTHISQLLPKVNRLMEEFGEERGVNSGWRTPSMQMKINPKAPKSKHTTGDAIDLEDKDGKLKEWCVDNQDLLEECELYMEHPSATPTWVHLQQIPPRSGNRIFYP